MDIEMMSETNVFSPLMKRYIALMVAFVCFNITIIYEDLKLMGSSSDLLLTFKISFAILDIIILFFYCHTYSIVLVFKSLAFKSKTKRILAEVMITTMLVVAFGVGMAEWLLSGSAVQIGSALPMSTFSAFNSWLFNFS